MVLIRCAALVTLAACSTVTKQENIAYDDRFGSYTTLDVYGADSGASPAVILIHGGSWRTGFKEQFDDVAERLAGAGYVAITINYRLGPDGAFPGGVQDCICALAYVRAHAAELGVDPLRVAVMGYSSGGHLAALVGVAGDDPRLAPDCSSGMTGAPAAVISGAAMHDLHDFSHYPTVRDFLGGEPDEVPAAYELASPLLQIGTAEPPFLLIHGTADVLTDAEQSVRMRKALTDTGNDARLLLLEGGGHLFNPSNDAAQTVIGIASDAPEAWLAISDFLDHTIGPP